jgi:hypothetical protein
MPPDKAAKISTEIEVPERFAADALLLPNEKER